MSKPTVAAVAAQVSALTATVETLVATMNAVVSKPAPAPAERTERSAPRDARPAPGSVEYCERYAPNLAAKRGADFERYLDKVAREHGYVVANRLHKAALALLAEKPATPAPTPGFVPTEAEMDSDIPF